MALTISRGDQGRLIGRVLPLFCGLYPFLVIFPTFAMLGQPSFLILAGYGACWLAYGIVTLRTAGRGTNAQFYGEPRLGTP